MLIARCDSHRNSGINDIWREIIGARIFTALAAVCGALLSSASAQPKPLEQPKQLKVLGQYVGDWTSEARSKPAAWTPKEVKLQTQNHAEFVLDGRVLQHIEVNHIAGQPEKVTKALILWTIDPKAERYVNWFFQSSGVIGKWDSTTKSLIATTSAVPMAKGKLTETFPNPNTIDGTVKFTSDEGETLFDMSWTRKRRPGIAGQPLRQRWETTGKPIEPIPEQVKKLQPLIGEWDAEFIQRPSLVSLKGNTLNGKSTAKWILDGRFLFGTTEVGNHKGHWIIGYDTNRKAYRYIRMTNSGKVDESAGKWNDDIRSFVFKVENERPGVTRTITTRLVGNDAIQSHIVAEDRDGKVQLDLTIRLTRRE